MLMETLVYTRVCLMILSEIGKAGWRLKNGNCVENIRWYIYSIEYQPHEFLKV